MDRKVHSGEMAKAYCCLHLSILFAGFTGILGKLIELPSGVMTWWRLLFTAVILISGSLFLRGREEVSWRDRLEISGAGLLLALHWIFFFGSIKMANVSIGVACFAMIGFFSAILEPLLLKRKFQWMELLFSLLAIAGILLVFSNSALRNVRGFSGLFIAAANLSVSVSVAALSAESAGNG